MLNMKHESIVKVLFFTFLVIKTETSAFRCNNGKEITDSRFCNSFNDCDDNSDEGYGCTRRTCRRGKFTCQNGSCIDIKVRCNGIIDCSDQSDEQNCPEQSRIEIQPQDCPLDQGKFLCKNKLACLNFSNACDDKCHCTDCSDENRDNCAKLDSESCRSCTQFCLPTPDGPQCVCNSSTYESSSLCKEIQSCTAGSACDHHCIRYRNFERCLCYDGYYEVPNTNGQKCQKKSWLKTILFYSTVTRIKSIDFTNTMVNIVQNGVYCTALTAARDYMYYASLRNNKGSVYKTLIGGGIPEHIVELDSRITSVSVDWVTNNVYFTNNGSLSVCTNNSKICVKLKCCNVDNVVVAPKFGWMFYTSDTMTDENDQFIMKSNMDGTGEEILLPDESFLSPVSLTTDELTETLYWLEVTEGKLHSVSFNGYNRQIDYLGDEEFSSLTVLDRTFYFAKHQNNSFYEYSSAPLPHYTGHQDNSTSTIRHLYVYNPELLQHTYQTEDPCIQSPCIGVCLIRPSSSSDLNFTCLCENFTPTDDNHWCNKDQKYSVQEDESSTTHSLQTSPAHDSGSTVELPLTTLDLVSITGFTETTQTPDEGSSSSNPHCITFTPKEQETHSSTGSSESTDTTSEKFNSPTEPNNINAAKQNTSSSSEPSLTPIAQGLDCVLIYSTVTKIKAWFLANGTHQVIQDGKETTALAGARNYIYFAGVDIHKGHIFRTSIKSGQTHEILWIDSQITSIAVDWITNNVYFTANSSLSVCSEYGEICAELICCDTDDVALAPNSQWMFYTAKMTSDDKRIIRRSGMDGSDDMVLLDESFYQFISLTVDESSGKVYWLEIEEQILHSVSFFGFGKEERLLKNENRSYRYFAVLEANFFFTMGRNGFEWQFPLWSHFWQDSSTNDVKFLHAFAPRSHHIDSVTNRCEFASCPGLCLLHPGSPGFTCMCENFTLIGVNYWCTKNITSASTVNSSILIQNKNKVQFLTEQSVESVNFTLGKTPKLLDVSLAAESSPPSVVSLQKDYHLIASGVLGFILGISTASFVIVMCFVFQKCSGRRDRKRIRIQDEMEM